MPSFSYSAIDGTGKSHKGTIMAESQAAAENSLAARGLIPTDITEAAESSLPGPEATRKRSYRIGRGGINSSELIVFTKQFHSMLKAGVPILRLLGILEAQTINPSLKEALGDIINDIRQGSTLCGALEKQPHIFPGLYRSMIRAGEMSGTVPEILARLVFIMEHEAKVKADIKAALQYPIIVIIALVLAFTVLLTFVIPKFADIFVQANLTLPLPTRISIGLYNFIGNYWFIILPLALVSGVVIARFLRTETGKLTRDRFLIGLPLLGTLFLKSAVSRLASILSMLHASGLDILTAIKIATDTIGNHALARELAKVTQSMQEGQGIARPLRQARYFPPMVVDMFAIGEESGRLDEMLREVSEHYDYEVAYEIKRLSEALGPVLIVGLAAVVGFFALAIFLPMWDLTRMGR